MSEPTVGVYVHVPFCERVCPYCDFAVVGGGLSPETEARTVAALRAELRARRESFAGRRLASVYLGGGTPSLLQPESVAALLEAVREAFPDPPSPAAAAREPVEVTLEANPGTVERTRLPGFRAAGVNRLSLGVQSFDDRLLKRLGRAHRADEARRSLAAAREAGFDNLSLDLMFAVPGQDLADLERDLAETLAFAPEHVSSYELVVEPDTPFALAERRGQLARADADGAADMLAALEAALSAGGLARYELTNHARPGRESRHNLRYWRREPVLGLGVGAFSQDPPRPAAPFGSRRRNPRSLAAWLAGVERAARCPDAPAEDVEVHDAATARAEALFLALRTREGLDAARFAAEFGAPPRAFHAAAIDRLVAQGLLRESAAGDLCATPRGMLLQDLLGEAFVEEPEPGPATRTAPQAGAGAPVH